METSSLWEQVQEAAKNKEWDKLADLSTEIIKNKLKGYNEAYYNLAVALYQQKEYDAALKTLYKVKNPNTDARKLYRLIKKKTKPEDSEEKISEEGDIYSLKFFKSSITFKDVIGLKKAKRYLQENIINALKYPKVYQKHGKRLSSAIILYGPPGTGKTMLAKAIAGETKANMLIVNIHQVLNKYVGTSEKNMEAIFRQAREHTPCIIFFDEFDALGTKRGASSDQIGEGSTIRTVVNSLLTELDGVEHNRDNIYIIAATNRPWDIDSALKRSGRFNNLLYITYPNLRDRIELLKLLLSNSKTGKINYWKLALRLAGYSPADIAHICDQAKLLPINRSITHSTDDVLTTADMMQTITTEKLDDSGKSWYIDTKKELIGTYETEIVDGKIHQRWKSGHLETNEKHIYAPLLKDINKYLSNPKSIRIQHFLAKIL